MTALWARDGSDWPNRQASRFVEAAGMRWHVQEMGAGPVLVLLHGTGAATHSWRGLAPLLARNFRVIAPDLPGHGFTSAPARYGQGLPGMAAALGELLETLKVAPEWLVGHSAGAAIAAHMALDGGLPRLRGVVSLNGAMLPIRGLLGLAFATGAGVLSLAPFAARLLAWHVAQPGTVQRLLRDTGSVLDAPGVDYYARLARQPGHVTAACNMMATWDLEPLERALPSLGCPLLLIAGDRDGMVPPETARRIVDRVPRGRVVMLPGLGHLAHEEAAERVAGEILGFTGEVDVRAA